MGSKWYVKGTIRKHKGSIITIIALRLEIKGVVEGTRPQPTSDPTQTLVAFVQAVVRTAYGFSINEEVNN